MVPSQGEVKRGCTEPRANPNTKSCCTSLALLMQVIERISEREDSPRVRAMSTCGTRLDSTFVLDYAETGHLLVHPLISQALS